MRARASLWTLAAFALVAVSWWLAGLAVDWLGLHALDLVGRIVAAFAALGAAERLLPRSTPKESA